MLRGSPPRHENSQGCLRTLARGRRFQVVAALRRCAPCSHGYYMPYRTAGTLEARVGSPRTMTSLDRSRVFRFGIQAHDGGWRVKSCVWTESASARHSRRRGDAAATLSFSREKRAEFGGSLPVRFLDEMGVDTEGRRGVRVSEPTTNVPYGHTFSKQASGGKIAEVVQARRLEVDHSPQSNEFLGDRVRYPWTLAVDVSGERVRTKLKRQTARRRPLIALVAMDG